MKKCEIREEDLENLEIPEYVYVSRFGKCYYPEKTPMASVKMPYKRAIRRGYKVSKRYLVYIEELYKKGQIKQKQQELC